MPVVRSVGVKYPLRVTQLQSSAPLPCVSLRHARAARPASYVAACIFACTWAFPHRGLCCVCAHAWQADVPELLAALAAVSEALRAMQRTVGRMGEPRGLVDWLAGWLVGVQGCTTGTVKQCIAGAATSGCCAVREPAGAMQGMLYSDLNCGLLLPA